MMIATELPFIVRPKIQAQVLLPLLQTLQKHKKVAGGAKVKVHTIIVSTLLMSAASAAEPPDADALLRTAFDNWRAGSSVTEVTMTVHRPDWERSLQLKAWTQGDDDALVRFTAPAKDAGNATLKVNDETWIFNPKLNRVIKLPGSMLTQSWMGSDFSYNDLSKANNVLTEYTHKIVSTDDANGHTVYGIEAMPKPGAPVVWGKLVVKVRDDGVMLGESYFDQDMTLVREMTTEDVGIVGGREFPTVMTMRPADQSDHWTTIETTSAEFGIEQPGYLFTLSNLQNPRN